MDDVSIKGTSSLEEAVSEILTSSDAVVRSVSKEVAKKTADDTAKVLRNTSPRMSGAYAKSWKVKSQDGGYVVYNEKHYRLTHLLENGHDVVVNGKKVGRAKAYPHIKPAEESGIKEFEDKCKEEIEKRLAR